MWVWSNSLAVPGVKDTVEGIELGMVPIEVTVAQSSTCPASSLKERKAASKERVIRTVLYEWSSEQLTLMSCIAS